MNEREAIQFILEELKEQRRADFDMYFEMRKTTTAQYERFLDRLREIDERDAESKVEILPEPAIIIPKEELPKPRFTGTPEELRVDRVQESGYKERVDSADVTEEIENFLATQKNPIGLPPIQKHIEKTFETHWNNFSTVMRRAVSVSPYIQVHKVSQRKYLYSYKEV